MFLGLPDPHPDPLITSTDPDPAAAPNRLRILPSSSKNSKKNLAFYCFCDFFMTFYQCASEDPDPYQNVTDPQHCRSVLQQKKENVGAL
jgi:hypothetical protein